MTALGRGSRPRSAATAASPCSTTSAPTTISRSEAARGAGLDGPNAGRPPSCPCTGVSPCAVDERDGAVTEREQVVCGQLSAADIVNRH